MSADHYTETDTEGETTFEIGVDEPVKLRYESPHADGPQAVQGMLRGIEPVPEGYRRPDDDTALWIDATDREAWVVLWTGRREVRSAREYDREEPTTDRRLGDLVEIEPLF